MAQQHPGDALSQDLVDYAEETSDFLAKSILGSPLAPRTAPMTSGQKLRVFSSQFWNPDGSVNAAGRDALQAKYGASGFATISAELARRHGQLHQDIADQADAADQPDALPEP